MTCNQFLYHLGISNHLIMKTAIDTCECENYKCELMKSIITVLDKKRISITAVVNDKRGEMLGVYGNNGANYGNRDCTVKQKADDYIVF